MGTEKRPALPLNSQNSDVTKKIQNERGVLSGNECEF